MVEQTKTVPNDSQTTDFKFPEPHSHYPNACPNCGYCPVCGRRNQPCYPYYVPIWVETPTFYTYC